MMYALYIFKIFSKKKKNLRKIFLKRILESVTIFLHVKKCTSYVLFYQLLPVE